MLRVTGKLGGYRPHPMIEHFKFVAAHTKATPKMTIPSPSSLHFRYGRDAVPAAIYPDMDDFYRDLGESLPQGGARLRRRRLPLPAARRGQFHLSLRSEAARAGAATAATIPTSCRTIYAGMINAAIADVPADMTITMHLCRGNFQSTFVASGGYEPVAEILFNEIKIDGYFMEYDTERAGGFEPLRFVPKGKTVVLGLVTSKTGTLESQGRAQAPHRRGGEVRAARSALPVAAMRLRLDRGGQSPHRGRAMGEARA